MIGPASIAIPYLLMVLVLLPLAGIRSYFRLKSGKPLPPKSRRYAAMIGGQVLLVACSFLVARKNDLDLLGKVPGVWGFVGSGLYLSLITLRMQRGWAKLSAERRSAGPRAVAAKSDEDALLGFNFLTCRPFGRMRLSRNGLHRPARRYWLGNAFNGCLRTGVWHCAHNAGLARSARNRCYRAAAAWHRLLTQGLYLAIAVHAAYDLVVGAIAVRHFRQDEMAATQAAQSASSGG
jgi:hypothetical protein